MRVLTKVVVGSRLHGLDTADSDWDYRGIHMHGLKTMLSPFQNIKNTIWLEDHGNQDDVSYELAEFCKLATRGNATILEILFSDNIVSTTPIADELRSNWTKLFDTDAFVLASRGYASNQYNKMQLFEPDQRTPKFAVAYIRVLWQCAEMLENGAFPCKINEPKIREFLIRIKSTPPDAFTPLVPELTQMFMEMQQRVTDAYKTAVVTKPDTEWIEDFLLRAYALGGYQGVKNEAK